MANILKRQMTPGLGILCGISLGIAAILAVFVIAAFATSPGAGLLLLPMLGWSLLWAWIWGSWGAHAYKKRQIVEHDLRRRGLE